MRTTGSLTCFVVTALVCGCTAAPRSAENFKNPSGPEFAKDREACMQQSAFDAAGGGKITFGGGYGGNTFSSAGPYLDCMVARGYRPDAIGDPLGTPATEKQSGSN